MWVYKGIKVNILATTQKNHYSINLQNKSRLQITTITAENTENSLNSVPHTIENIQFKNWEILTYCKAKLGTFLKCHSYCCTNIVNCSYAKCQKAAINCS